MRRRSGFTLVELLVVVTILLINFGPNAGTSGSDGYADNIFNVAQKGQAAGR